jgi:hypothetical protein
MDQDLSMKWGLTNRLTIHSDKKRDPGIRSARGVAWLARDISSNLHEL